MSNINLSPLGPFSGTNPGRGAQVLPGRCSQPRVDAAIGSVFQQLNAPLMTILTGTLHLAVYARTEIAIYVGPPPVDNTELSARAQVFGAGWWPIEARTGDVVFARDL